MATVYEGMFLLDNEVVREDWKTAKALVTATIEKHGGTIHTARRWEERPLAYPIKGKKLSNMRASGKDDSVVLTPPLRFSLEEAMEFLDDGELLEITPTAIRLRKRHLTENARVLAAKKAAAETA